MSTIYNPEADVMAEIERLEIEARELRRKVEHAKGEEDKRVLNHQMIETQQRIDALRTRLP